MDETTTKVFAALLEATTARSIMAQREARSARDAAEIANHQTKELARGTAEAVEELSEELDQSRRVLAVSVGYLAVGAVLVAASVILAHRRIEDIEAGLWDLRDKLQRLQREARSGLAS